MASPIYDFEVTDIDGKNVKMSEFKGKVLLIVNVASHCGFTPQYKELVALHEKYQSQGFEVLGFPCNQFNSQEKGDNEQIKKFAESKGVKFPMMSKIDVNGSNAIPLYTYLKSQQKGWVMSAVKWNFTKFLVDRDGQVVARYAPTTNPSSIDEEIKKCLDNKN